MRVVLEQEHHPVVLTQRSSRSEDSHGHQLLGDRHHLGLLNQKAYIEKSSYRRAPLRRHTAAATVRLLEVLDDHAAQRIEPAAKVL